jgi:3'-phosphoadenosine 5'-phosphosulfate sulfotransferase (PAPS reductase)/FAD synthetase
MKDYFKINGPTCISFSGGRTSAYMLWRVLQSNGGLPNDAIVCFANTGKEDEETLRFVDRCSKEWGVPIVWLEYRPDKYITVDFESASRNGEPFDYLTTKKSYLPNAVARFCTEELKVKPIKAFSQMDDDQTMVGVRADEPRRIFKMRTRGMMIPLADSGVTQLTVQSFWKSNSFDLELEFQQGVTSLGNCDLCFMKGASQILSVIQAKPDRAVWWANQEKKIGATFRSDRPSYANMLKFTQEQRDLFADGNDGIACFCGD